MSARHVAQADAGDGEEHTAAPASSNDIRRFLLVCPQTLDEFRLPEIESAASAVGVTLRYDGEPSPTLPYVIVKGETREVRAVVERSVCIKFCVEIWGEGTSWAECHAAVRAQPANVTTPLLESETPFRCAFESWGRKRIPQTRRAELLRGAEYLNLRGPVSMKAAERVFVFVERFADPEDLEPALAFFGPLVAESRRDDISAYDLRRRKMIGNTSMDPELSFIMASMARAAPGALVLDPFVGTGSLLYAAAHFGAMVVGCDINKAVLHGLGKTSRTGVADKKRGPDENIAATMAQYGLQDRFLGLWLIDQSRHAWRVGGTGLFDAIVTDPPYGIREGARKVAVAPPPPPSGADQKAHPASYWRQLDTGGYAADTVFADLLDFAAQFLCLNGRLVYWLPVIPATYTDEQVPRHPCLELVSNSEQPLSKYARRLITMEKTSHWDPSLPSSSSKASALNNDFRSKVMAPREPEPAVTVSSARRLHNLDGVELMHRGVSEDAWEKVQEWMDRSGQLQPERVGVRRARLGPLVTSSVADGDGADGGGDEWDALRSLLAVLDIPCRAGARCVVTEYQRWQGVDYTTPFDGLDNAVEVVVCTFGDARSLRFRDGPLARSRDDGREQQRYSVDVGHCDRFTLRGSVLDGWEHSLAPGTALFVIVSVAY